MMATASTVRSLNGAEAGLSVERVSLSHYRNYRQLRLQLEPGSPPMNVLTGPNGSGKTNFLEALSYLAPGRGLRGARLAEVSQRGAGEPWAVAAVVSTPGGRVEIGTGLSQAPRDQTPGDQTFSDQTPGYHRRLVRIDETTAPGPAALGPHVSIVWLSPRMDRLFKESASGRRRFFDRLALGLHPHHGRRLSAYEKAVRERLHLLAAAAGPADPAWLSALERKISENGVAIAAGRLDTITHLQEQISRSADGPFPKADLKLEGTLEERLLKSPAIEVEDAFAEELLENRTVDREASRQSVGPHRSDLLVSHRIKNMPAGLCSTGEQKALLINMVLADARMQTDIRGIAPILLLDEVAAHLDQRRLRALFGELAGLESQIWLTGTNAAAFEALSGSATFYSVEKGSISGPGGGFEIMRDEE